METLRLNRHVPLDRQYAVHTHIVRDLLNLEDALVWSGMPKPFQLLKVCEMIHDHFDGYALSRYGVTSGLGLKAELDRLRLAQTFRSYIDPRRSEERTAVLLSLLRQLFAVVSVEQKIDIK